MIMGTNLLSEQGIVLDFKTKEVVWDKVSVPMKSIDCNVDDFSSYHVQDSETLEEETERLKRILDAKYSPADLDALTQDMDNLSEDEQTKLKKLLKEYSDLFDGTLGHWKDADVNIELKADAKPYHARAYPIPKAYENTLKMEIEQLCKIGVLKKVNHSEWAAPTFIIPKKNKTV